MKIMAVVDAHVARGRDLLVAWRKSRLPGMAPVRAQEAQQAVKTNGHVEPVKLRRGGWPKGKPRKPQDGGDAAVSLIDWIISRERGCLCA
jgi:hypothetical protein